jgi:hypothetical protein
MFNPKHAFACAVLAFTCLASNQAVLAGKPHNLLSGQAVVSTQEKNAYGQPSIKGRILIEAPPAVVWETVHKERNHDPDIAYSKILEQSKDHSVLEQKFILIPVIGSAICVMSNDEVPLQRIDYHLLKSDRHFKAMDGSWVLTPHDDGRATILELSSHLELSFPVPRKFLEGISAGKVQKRLQRIKKMAENEHRLAQRSL